MEPLPPPGCSLPLDLILEIVSRCSTVATVILCAATCKFLRRSMAEPAFLRRLGCSGDDGFDRSLLAGHFHFEKRFPKLFDPFFVASNSNHPVVPPARIGSFVSGLSRKTFPNYFYKPLASRGGLLLLRRIDRYGSPNGELLVCNPTRRFDGGRIPATAGIPGDSYILFPCDDDGGVGRSFQLISVRIVDNLVQAQAFTSSYAALRQRPPQLDGLRWGEFAETAIAGPNKVKVARHSVPPVLLRGVAYWLCKDSGTYRVMSLRVDTMEASYVAALPPECSSTAVFSRKEILVVASPPERRLGLLTLGGEVLTLWTLDDGWTRRATVRRAEIACSAGVSSRPWPFHWKTTPMELECCDERSSTVWLRIPGHLKAAVLSLQTMEAEVRLLDNKDPSIVCPYETMDFATCIATMKQF